ncbi:YbjN domain-containing protein [Actinomyces trachealis]|uniref:YbjN domain-containing protein n=1 Tax=Actinomyces trachealis TaxID=2763540 RepID=UPI001892A1DB|nr:YbjN domain-containing protein [Actinomyces trachealis]
MPSPSPAAAGTEAPRGAVPTPVDVSRVLAAVKSLGLRHFVDDEGDVGIPWRYVTVHVVFQDTRAIQVRGAWHRIATIDHLARLRALVEEWNVSKLGPKAYLTVSDGGMVRLHGEVTLPLEAGMTDAQLEDFVFTGCRFIVALMRHAEEVFPDPLCVPEDS